jgi:hypothetical protein
LINALRYTEQLEEAGFTPEQAKSSVKIWMDLMNDNFATKFDVERSEFALRADMKAMENSLRSDMKEMESGIRSDMKEMESGIRSDMNDMGNSLRMDMKSLELRMTVKLGGLMVLGIGLMNAFNRLSM